jgi:drug/metabolite transporter (DMT)-like permease
VSSPEVTSAEVDGPVGTRADGPLLTAVLLAVGVAGVSLAAPIGAAAAAPALAIAFWRNASGAVVAGVTTAVLPSTRAELRNGAARRARRPSIEAGIWLAVHFATWMPSLKLTSVAAATALVCSTPVWLVAWDLLRRKHVRPSVLAGVGLSLTGVLLITGVDATASREALLGDLLALVGGVTAGGYVLAGSRARAHVSTTTYTLLTYTVCASLLLALCLATGTQLVGFTRETWLLLAAVTVFAQLLGHSVFNRTLRTAGPTAVALTLLLEVPGASVVAWLWFGLPLPPALLPGAALLLLGLVVVIVRNVTPRRGDVPVTGQ